MDLNGVLLDNQPRPNPSHQIVFADHVAIRQREHTENVERPAPKRHRRFIMSQLAAAQVQAELAKPDLIPVHCVQP